MNSIMLSLLRVAPLLWLALGWMPAGAVGNVFTANYARDQFPTYGFNGVAGECCAEWERKVVAADVRAGGDALLIAQRPGSDGEFGTGNEASLEPPAQGSTWYLRGRVKWSADTNFKATDPQHGPINFSTGKLLMLPPSSAKGLRAALLWESDSSAGVGGGIKWYPGGASDGWQTDYVSKVGVWINWQLEIVSSSTCGVSDGRMTLWINNNVYERPTPVRDGDRNKFEAAHPRLNICTSDWTTVRYGAYQNKGLQRDGVNNMLYSAFEIGTTFDPHWSPDARARQPLALMPSPRSSRDDRARSDRSAFHESR
jgi:hypothetical protein